MISITTSRESTSFNDDGANAGRAHTGRHEFHGRVGQLHAGVHYKHVWTILRISVPNKTPVASNIADKSSSAAIPSLARVVSYVDKVLRVQGK